MPEFTFVCYPTDHGPRFLLDLELDTSRGEILCSQTHIYKKDGREFFIINCLGYSFEEIKKRRKKPFQDH